MINLTELVPVHDVLVRAFSDFIIIDFSGASFTDEVKDSLFSFKAKGMSVYNCYSHRIDIYTQMYDPLQTAEIVSTYLESKGLKVRRLVSDPHKHDQTPSIEVQSFILA